MLQGLYKAFHDTDASGEINPLVITGDGRVIALDAKLNLIPTRSFVTPEIVEMRDLDEEDPAEIAASSSTSRTISLDGDIGCRQRRRTGDGDDGHDQTLRRRAANFLDVGGGAAAEKVTEAFKIMLRHPGLKAILVNIFGGIMKCDTIAEGVVAASKAVAQGAARRAHERHQRGTRTKILAESGLPIISANNMAKPPKKSLPQQKATEGQ